MEPVNYFHKTLYLRCLTGFLIQSRYYARTVKSHIIHMKIGQTLKHYKYISNLNMLFLDFVESSYILQLYLFLTISTFLRIWKYLTTWGVLHGSIFGPLFFLIYINLYDGLTSNAELFVWMTPVFPLFKHKLSSRRFKYLIIELLRFKWLSFSMENVI